MDLREKALWFLVLAGLVLLVAATPSGPSPQMVFDFVGLQNPGFEDDPNTSWQPAPFPGVAFSVVDDPVPGQEDHAASLSRNDLTTGEVYFFQNVDDIVEGATYSLSAMALRSDLDPDYDVYLEIKYFCDPGTGSYTCSTLQSDLLVDAQSYTLLSIDPHQAPPYTVKARIKAVLYIKDSTAPTVYFDDFSFLQVSDPPTPTPTPTPTATPTPVSWPKILLNEILPSPRKKDWNGDGQKSILDEWVELYNATDAPVDLGGWILDDIEAVGSSNPYLIPAGTIIAAKGRIVLFRSETNITLNDVKETVRLLHPDGTQADKFRYKKTPGYDRSFSRKGDGAKKWVKKCAVTMGTPNCK